MTRAIKLEESDLKLEGVTTQTVVPPSIKIIGSARNIDEVPRVAEMIKRLEESMRNKSQNSKQAINNDKALNEKIWRIITERRKDLG